MTECTITTNLSNALNLECDWDTFSSTLQITYLFLLILRSRRSLLGSNKMIKYALLDAAADAVAVAAVAAVESC